MNKEDSNITIYDDKIMGESYVMITVNQIEDYYSPDERILRYVIQSDSIDHFDRNEPLKPNYDSGESEAFSPLKQIYTIILLNYLEYETDNGIFFSNNKIYKGIEFYNQEDKMPLNYVSFIHDNETIDFSKEEMCIFFLRINGKSFERYKRTYPKFQSLIAEVISTIELIVSIYKWSTNNVYSNTMVVEIIRSILSKINYDEEIKSNLKNINYINNKIEPINIGPIVNVHKEKIKYENTNRNANISLSTVNEIQEKAKSDILNNLNINQGETINEINKYKDKNCLLEKMNKINFWNILFYKFCCCFKKERKIIKKCNELVDSESSIDYIIYRMLKLENIEGQKISENDKVKEIINLLEET